MNCFGFTVDMPYGSATDTLEEIKKWRSSISIETIVNHMATLDVGYMCSLGLSKDLFTGEEFPAGIIIDGTFVYPIDILRFLKRGDIHGVPKEYEEYLIEHHGL